jgi:hypothetical protein
VISHSYTSDIVTTNQPAKEHTKTNVDWYGRSQQARDIYSIKRVSGGVDTVELRRGASRRVDKKIAMLEADFQNGEHPHPSSRSQQLAGTLRRVCRVEVVAFPAPSPVLFNSLDRTAKVAPTLADLQPTNVITITIVILWHISP